MWKIEEAAACLNNLLKSATKVQFSVKYSRQTGIIMVEYRKNKPCDFLIYMGWPVEYSKMENSFAY